MAPNEIMDVKMKYYILGVCTTAVFVLLATLVVM